MSAQGREEAVALVVRAFNHVFGPNAGRVFRSDAGPITVSHAIDAAGPLVLVIVKADATVQLLLDNFEGVDAGDAEALGSDLAVVANATSYEVVRKQGSNLSDLVLSDGRHQLRLRDTGEQPIDGSVLLDWLDGLAGKPESG